MGSHRITTGFVLVLVNTFCLQAMTYAMRPVLSYAVLAAGGAPSVLGIVATAFALPSLALAIPAGRLLDRWGVPPVFVGGSVVLVASAVVGAAGSSSILALLVSTVLLGLGHISVVLAQQASIASFATPGRLVGAFGLYTLVASAGQAIGPALLLLPGGTAAAPASHLILLVCAAISLVMLVAAVGARGAAVRPVPAELGVFATGAGLLRLPGFARALLATTLVLSSIDIFLAFAPAYGLERAVPTAVVSAMLIVRSASSMVSRLLLSRLDAALGRRTLMIGSISLAAAALVVLVLPLPAVWLIVASAAFGFFIGVCQPVTLSWITELSPVPSRGLAMSLRLATNRLGQAVVPLSVGAFAAAAGASGVLAVTGVVLAVAAWSSAAVGRSDTLPGATEAGPDPDRGG